MSTFKVVIGKPLGKTGAYIYIIPGAENHTEALIEARRLFLETFDYSVELKEPWEL